jgi:hypothetical protein
MDRKNIEELFSADNIDDPILEALKDFWEEECVDYFREGVSAKDVAFHEARIKKLRELWIQFYPVSIDEYRP